MLLTEQKGEHMCVNSIPNPTFVKIIDDRGKERIINRDRISTVEMDKNSMNIIDNKDNIIASINNPNISLTDFANKLGDVIDLTA